MVFELKPSKNGVPGVLIFSHKEYKLLFNKKSENKYLKRLRDNYFIGIHWGASEDNVIKNKMIDFHLCLPGLLSENTIPNSELVNLTTRNFLSRDYKNLKSEKFYDIITVGRKVKVKRYLEFFLIIKEVMKVKPDLRVMIVAPEDKNVKKSTFDFLFEENLNEIFTESEKKNITIYSGNSYLSRNEIIDLLNKSKIFLFTSIREGVAKVTGEAALCGLRVLIYKYFRGNATYGIDKKQYSLFEDVEDCASQILSILSETESTVYFNKGLYEDESLLKLDLFLSELYKNNKYEFDGEYISDDLMNNLNSFNNYLPKKLVLGNSNDLKNNYSFLKYCESKSVKTNLIDYMFCYLLDIKTGIREAARKWKNLVPLFVWKIYRRRNQYNKLFK
tara:strand:+ start:2146 stop:3312 length:1167 start_codon:yes stop_codon:yes gene_type:complete